MSFPLNAVAVLATPANFARERAGRVDTLFHGDFNVRIEMISSSFIAQRTL